ncbi:MAG TPA: exosortase E/protease, VPEID-CTERM system [Bryobacteraceae bacterium]|nr:exosortase E/protease, VPEID-CTERM system [Bryobacteraceae bacterium]
MTKSRVSGERPVCELAPSGAAPRVQHRGYPLLSLGLATRFTLFSLLFAAEGIPISNLVHKSRGAGTLVQIAVVFFPLLLAIGYSRSKETFRMVSFELKSLSLAWPLLAAHVLALLAFLAVSLLPGGARGLSSQIAWTAIWYTAGLCTISFALLAFLPLRAIRRLLATAGNAWLYAIGAAVLAQRVIVNASLWNGAVWNPAIDLSWKPVTDFTFGIVLTLLRMVLPNVIADRSSMTIGTPQFNVQITPWCAGFEGTALMLVFGVAWLAFFRREYRFPQALALVPAGMAVIWIANGIRITALILIGVAGAPNVAVNGFHSQAGWIAFTCVALGFSVLSRRFSWCSAVAAREHPTESSITNPTAAYLMPFVVLMAAGMISTAASAGFEWLYPLRVLAAGITLWYFRSKYAELDWRFGWFSALAGIAVLALWLGLERFSGVPTQSPIAAGLASLPTAGRIVWLVFRTVGAVFTVPVAEELAFRGFLIRRIISADFDALSTRRYTYLAVVISSVAFGSLHGGRWIAGSVAGLIYAAAYLRRGRIGDAVFAHALTNALLAAFVLSGDRWYLW